jgi:hypothetical protein
MIKRWFITLGNYKIIFHMFSNSIDCEILTHDRMRLKRVSNSIQIINDYNIKNKYDLTK